MKKTVLAFTCAISLLFSNNSFAVNKTVETDPVKKNFTLYLVRHAEKQQKLPNPALTQCGKLRAQQLATLLSQVNIKDIYSTHYQRTMLTAAPLAKQQNVSIKNYSPRGLAQLALQLKQRKQNALIVGHSNTTPQLAQIITDKKVAPLTEQDYQQLYQIQFINEQVILTVFKQPLICR